jgi:hypothetical protein
MAMLSAAASPFCRIAPECAFCKPEEDPFLLLESSLMAIKRILQLRRGLPLRRTSIEQPMENRVSRSGGGGDPGDPAVPGSGG